MRENKAPVASQTLAPTQPAVHDQTTADALIEGTDRPPQDPARRSGSGGWPAPPGVDVVLHYYRDGPTEAAVSVKKAAQRSGQPDRWLGPVAQLQHDLVVTDGRAYFDAYAD